MAKLKYKLTNDILFKMLFVRNPDLLKRLTAAFLRVPITEINEFTVTNPEMPPEAIGEKFCRLDIKMLVNGQILDLEIQVADEKDYRERSLFHWARAFSSALDRGKGYRSLPKTIVVSILAFPLFECEVFHSE
ncbi:MAG: Rpn family recombination-promoting nuclease/putative transposase, partial [Treponema sp.]|nr:Rpn family recombination-promoting nuclease/putative transposase [Treponema sp.]